MFICLILKLLESKNVNVNLYVWFLYYFLIYIFYIFDSITFWLFLINKNTHTCAWKKYNWSRSKGKILDIFFDTLSLSLGKLHLVKNEFLTGIYDGKMLHINLWFMWIVFMLVPCMNCLSGVFCSSPPIWKKDTTAE